jgi:hypothetical protein
MPRDFLFGATPDVEWRGSRLLSAAEADAQAADAAAKANATETRPVYHREVAIPRARFGRWVWKVDTEVRGERVTVVGPRKAWTKRAAERRAFRHYERLTREAAER